MSIFHLSVKNGKKGKGKHHAQYISCENKYEKKSDLVMKFEQNIPSFAQNAVDFFTAADNYERANGRSYKELEISLSRELSNEMNIECLKEFIAACPELKNKPMLVAVHGGKNGDNPHAHVMFSERANKDFPVEIFFTRNGSNKDRDLNNKNFVKEIRSRWQEKFNDFLAGNNLSEVSAKSLKAQNIQRLPQPKLGYAAQAIHARSSNGSDRHERFNSVCEKNVDLFLKQDSKSIYFMFETESKLESIKKQYIASKEIKKPPASILSSLFSKKKLNLYNEAQLSIRNLAVEFDKIADNASIKTGIPKNKLFKYFKKIKKEDVDLMANAKKSDAREKQAEINVERIAAHHAAKQQRMAQQREIEARKASADLPVIDDQKIDVNNDQEDKPTF